MRAIFSGNYLHLFYDKIRYFPTICYTCDKLLSRGVLFYWEDLQNFIILVGNL